ncbi:MAG: adenine phosphoribosyltransferase [Spirochaetales bacterium]|nr:adenine phosphoribosyltransferase [Spirochaetales bacterium]
MKQEYDLDAAIRKIPDFPKKGILFYDITSILINPEAFNYCIDRMEGLYRGSDITAIAAIESRGFIFASPLANRLGLPLLIIRKKGKLPGETYAVDISLEYGVDTVEVHKSDVRPGMRFLLIDDLIATGGTLKGTIELLKKGGGTVAEIFGVVGLPFLKYEELLAGYRITTLIDYHGE